STCALVGAVQDAGRSARAPGEPAFEPAAVFRRKYLLGIFSPHGRERVGEKNPAFKKIDLAVKLEIFRREVRRIETQQRPFRIGKRTLMREVMNCKNGFRRRPRRAETAQNREVRRWPRV